MNASGQPWPLRSWDKPAALTLGNFDGVHLGHRAILNRLIAWGEKLALQPVVITFEPHPRHFFHPDDPCSRLSSPTEKIAALKEFPVEIVTLAFDRSLAAIAAETFIREFLWDKMRGRAFLLGYDHRFGAGAKGDAQLLRQVVGAGVPVEEIPPLSLGDEVVSSSAIREHLETGRLAAANALLGRPFSYTGKVVTGAGRAKTLGVPTANIDPGYPEKVRVASGVYFGKAQWGDSEFFALANIGFSPTFAEGKHKFEVHIPGFSGSLYGEKLTFFLLHRHRAEIKFPHVEALKAQIDQDLSDFRAFTESQAAKPAGI